MTTKPTTKKKWRVSRRGFLIGAGALGGGLALGYVFGWPLVQLRAAEALDRGNGRPAGEIATDPAVWIEITPANEARFYLPKIEMGQGVHTALAQIMAEELGVAWEAVRVVQADTARGPVDGDGTTGSTTVSSMWPVLREVAASLREMLRAEAARQLQVGAETLSLADGVVMSPGGDRLTFGEVVQRKQGAWEAPAEPPGLKTGDYKLVGQSMPRIDLPAKVTGAAIYGFDARLPGMLYGAMAQPPNLGAMLKRAAPGTAAAEPGVVQVVIGKDYAGIVAESRAQAHAALDELDLAWDTGKLWTQTEIDAQLDIDPGAGIVIQQEGDGAGALRDDVIEAHYATPMAAHAHLEPQGALVEVLADRARVWVSTQLPALTRTAVAEALGLKPEAVEIYPLYVGGGFGRKYGSDVAVAAARLAQAVGRPVHVGWTRTEEFQNGYLRPPTQHQLKGALGADGRVTALGHWQSSGEVAAAFVPGFILAVTGDFAAWRGARIQYAIPHRFTRTRAVKLPVPTSWWRGLGLLANTFAVESFMDELAHTAGVDPLGFRLRQLPAGETGERLGAVLRAAAEAAGWDTPAPSGRARGLACCSDVGTLVAQVAEVSLEGSKIRVHKVTCAIDPGLIINPDGVRAQVEGAITMGLSSTLIEAARVVAGRIEANNFDVYPLLTMADAPAIEVVLLQGGAAPRGVGEPPIGPIAGAVANAVFALTGQRLRQLPLKLA